MVLDNEVALVIQRSWAPGTHLTNSQQGGSCTLVAPEDLHPDARTLAVSAANIIGSEVAGANVIQHWTGGRWYVLDVNANPAIVTGAFVEHKIAAYLSFVRNRLRDAPDRRHDVQAPPKPTSRPR